MPFFFCNTHIHVWSISSSHSRTTILKPLALCLGSLSFWKVNLLQVAGFLQTTSGFFPKISLHTSAFISPSTLRSLLGISMMQPHPCFTVGMQFWSHHTIETCSSCLLSLPTWLLANCRRDVM